MEEEELNQQNGGNMNDSNDPGAIKSIKSDSGSQQPTQNGQNPQEKQQKRQKPNFPKNRRRFQSEPTKQADDSKSENLTITRIQNIPQRSEKSYLSNPNLQKFIKDHPRQIWAYMVLAGLTGQLPMFMMLAEVHTFEKRFKDYNFSFFVMIPVYACIPYSLLAMKLMASLDYSYQIYINLTFICVFMALIPYCFFLVEFQQDFRCKYHLWAFFDITAVYVDVLKI